MVLQIVAIRSRRHKWEDGMSIKIMSWVWEHSPYKGEALLIHLAVADYANDQGMCWPTQETLAQKARCSTEHVRRVVKRMQEDGYISIVAASKGPGSSHTYKLEYPTSGGVLPQKYPTSNTRIPHIQAENTPHSSPNNRQEPSIEPVRVACPYCNRKFTWGKPHDCPAMNQRIK